MPRTSSSNRSIAALVADFASRLEHLTKRLALEQVLAALGGEAPASAPSGKRRGRPPGSKNKVRAAKPGKRGKRTAGDLEKLGGNLLAHVKANPGQRADQIAEAVGTDVGTMRLPMKQLIAAKQIRTQGQRRGTTYYVGAGGGGNGKAKAAKRGRKAGKRGPKRKGKSKAVRAQAKGTLIPAAKSKAIHPAFTEAPQVAQRVKLEAVSAGEAA